MERLTGFLMRVLIILASIVAAATATAEPWQGNTANVPHPYTPTSTTEDALVMFKNAAGLGMVSDVQIVYLHNDLANTAGRGDAFALQLGTVGFGLQYVRPPALRGTGDYLKYSVPVGIPLGDRGALGIGLDVIDPAGSCCHGSAVAWNAGMLLRPARFLSLGLSAENLGSPEPFGRPLRKMLTFGAGVRPLGEVLTLAGDFHFAEGSSQPPAEFYVRLVPVRGFALFARVGDDSSYTLGATLDFAHLGLTASPNAGADGKFAGMSYAVRLSASAYDAVAVAQDQVAVIVINRTLRRKGVFDFDPLGLNVRTPLDVAADIDDAARNPVVAAILLRVEDNDLSLAQADEIARALDAFRARGKKVFCMLDAAGTVDYLLATSADAVFAAPGGHYLIGGPKAEMLFFKGTLDKLDVKVQAARAGKYKSFVEKLTRDGPSPESVEQIKAMLDDFNKEFVARVARARKIAPAEVKALLDRGLFSPEEARDAGLVDAVVHAGGVEKEIERRLGRRVTLNDDLFDTEPRRAAWLPPPRVAVLKIEGTIVHGEGSAGIFGAGTTGNTEICEAAAAIGDDSQIRAVVLRIDSGGGSGLASEVIWRCLRDLRDRKPVVASMGGAAASGGYYVAVPASAIYADPFTVTGSIGVWGLKLNLTGLAAKLGITQHTIKVNRAADVESLWRDLDPDEVQRFQQFVDGFYAQFKMRVAEGRGLSLDAVEKVAQGRIWSGGAAKTARLVDEVGGFRDALAKAKALAGIDPAQRVTVEFYPERPSILKTIGKRAVLYADPVGALKKGLKDGARTDPDLEMPYEMEIK